MTTEVRLLGLNEYSEIAAFIDQHWKKDHAYAHSKELFDWTFKENPAWNKQDCYSFSVAVDKGSIIGMLGAIPFKLNDHGKTINACWLTNWIVLPEVKGGKGLALLNLFSKEHGFDTVSFGINNKVASLYAALGWQEMQPIARMEWISPFKIDSAEDLIRMTNPAACDDTIREYIAQASAVTYTNDQPEARSLNEVDAATWNRKGWNIWIKKTIGCAREYAYLNWRYLHHPVYQYETRVVVEDDRLGLIVWRSEITRKVDLNGECENYVSFIRIVEFLPVSDANARNLMSICLFDGAKEGAVAADFYCYSAELMQTLKRIGFFISDDTSGVCLPNHTQPIAQGSNIRSTIKVFSDKGHAHQDTEWYWTRSDSDQDRPN